VLLNSDVGQWSDGYSALVEATLGTNSIPTAAGENSICFGTALTAAAAPNGAYCLTWVSEDNGSGIFS